MLRSGPQVEVVPGRHIGHRLESNAAVKMAVQFRLGQGTQSAWGHLSLSAGMIPLSGRRRQAGMPGVRQTGWSRSAGCGLLFVFDQGGMLQGASESPEDEGQQGYIHDGSCGEKIPFWIPRCNASDQGVELDADRVAGVVI